MSEGHNRGRRPEKPGFQDIEPGHRFRCECGRLIDGDLRNSKGHCWTWRAASGKLYCGPQCPRLAEAEGQIAIDDEALGEQQAEAARAKYEGEE